MGYDVFDRVYRKISSLKNKTTTKQNVGREGRINVIIVVLTITSVGLHCYWGKPISLQFN